MEPVTRFGGKAPLDPSVFGEEFLRAHSIAKLRIVEETGSTNTDLVAAVSADPDSYPDFSVLTAEHQSAARGRLDRAWESPRLSSVSVSVVLRPQNASGRPLPTQSYSWFSLLAALALSHTITQTAGLAAGIKWPNDVLINGKKVSGILAQLVPLTDGAPPAVVLGTGINVSMTVDEMPVPTATSLAAEGASTADRTAVLASYLTHFSALYRSFCAVDGDPNAALQGGRSLRELLVDAMLTLGQRVRAQLPGDKVITGLAQGLDEYGALVVMDTARQEHLITAGDVIHLRPADGGYA
ncbi:biotin--[acetyl-CoA-carboxylase] ligase [Pseudarthrobacter sp. J1738]|uniref:biotin--[acetyl-CoA-carboxylase] ligase n=1 Tax=unclassified Pseudarthrobacter TaxID=2647000 RepID=UPI003D2A1ADF